MKYSEFIKQHRDRFWASEQGRIVESKHKTKHLATMLEIPCPKTYHIMGNAILKPDKGHSGKLCRVIENKEDWILEEYIPHDVDYKFFMFNGEPRHVQISAYVEKPSGMFREGIAHYTYPDWELVDIETCEEKEKAILPPIEKPACAGKMVEYAKRIAEHITLLPVRVDFFIHEGEPVLNEICVTPGFVLIDRITDEGDEMLGSYCEKPSDYGLSEQLLKFPM